MKTLLIYGLLAVSAVALAACGSSGAGVRILTPYGNYDGTTSNTIDLDLRPYLPPPPPPKDYTPQTLEK